MPTRPLAPNKIRKLIAISTLFNFSKTRIAHDLRISRSTLQKYLSAFKRSSLTIIGIEQLSNTQLANAIDSPKHTRTRSDRYITLNNQFRHVYLRLQTETTSLQELWKEYVALHPSAYKYTHFCNRYGEWCREHNLKKRPRNTQFAIPIRQSDLRTLNVWQRSNNRKLWERATAIQSISRGDHFVDICHKIERSHKTVKQWLRLYQSEGLAPLLQPHAKARSPASQRTIREKGERLLRLIHETPHLHKINRASWSLGTLAQVYEKLYGTSISKSSISEFFKTSGYKFKKAKRVLTSPDPEFREKLAVIKQALARLSSNEKYFSIDEFGPFSVKLRGGRALVAGDTVRTIPQRQKSKGSLICTAALELSSNQMTHFYSPKKNTDEMIKLLKVLMQKYRCDQRIFLSWDSASWHVSKALYKRVEEVNGEKYRSENVGPLIELLPLPTGAQFLNVIESVFSGMSRAILHNSNYQSVDECKAAIDRYISDRNKYFVESPKRAGNKIWGGERVEAVFREENNCKDPNWR
jgi:transposase